VNPWLSLQPQLVSEDNVADLLDLVGLAFIVDWLQIQDLFDPRLYEYKMISLDPRRKPESTWQDASSIKWNVGI